MADDIAKLLRDGHRFRALHHHFFGLGDGDNLFRFQRQQAQHDHFPPWISGIRGAPAFELPLELV
jgi:hypothetical protein